MDPLTPIWIAMFVCITICFCTYFILMFRERQQQQETIRQALNLEQPLDKDSLSLLTSGLPSRESDLRRAYSNVGLGFGVLGASLVLYSGGFGRDSVIPIAAVSMVVIGQGLGRLLAVRLSAARRGSPDHEE